MSGRIFQNVVLQFKETTDRTIGVLDAEGTVIACSELTGIGKKWTKYVEPIAAAEGACITLEGRTFKALPSWSSHFDYAVFASGDDSMSRTVCSMAAVSLNAAKSYYEEKHDKATFVKNIISDNKTTIPGGKRSCTCFRYSILRVYTKRCRFPHAGRKKRQNFRNHRRWSCRISC